MSPCANASSEAKVKHVIAAVKCLSYVANVLMRRCDIVKAPMDEETVPDTAKYWSYGKVLGWTSERRELIIVQFDENDAALRDCPRVRRSGRPSAVRRRRLCGCAGRAVAQC